MALLSEAERKEYFNYLGLGEYNKENILKLQKKYLLRKSDWDGIYGTNTDNLLRHLKAVKDNCTTFAPEEFRCGCNGRYCCGYPTWMKPMELANIQAIRNHYGKPMTVTCGVRCSQYNKAVGGISNSEHKVGLAVDYYIQGVTDTLANRKSSIKWICTLPNHHYTYGNGIYAETVNGRTKTGSVSASGMGNCMHTDCYDGTPTPAGKIAEDGIAGASTVRRMQKVYGTAEDGVISGQRKDLISKYFPTLISVDYNKVKSTLVQRIQRWAGVSDDGVWGKGTSTAVQNKLNSEGYNCGSADGIFGAGSTMAFQRWLNDHDTPTPDTPTPTPTKNIFDKGVDWLYSIANDNSWHYVKYNSKDAKTKECPICHNHAKGKYHGWNCIGESFAFWRHGCGIPCKCANNVINNAVGDKVLKMSDAEALKTLRSKIGLNDIQVIRNGRKAIPQSWLKKGDICLQYKGNTYVHTFPYIGNGYTIDCGNYKSTAKQIAKRKAPSCKVAIRYTGK